MPLEEAIDEVFSPPSDFALRKWPELDDLHPTRQRVGDVLDREEVG